MKNIKAIVACSCIFVLFWFVSCRNNPYAYRNVMLKNTNAA